MVASVPERSVELRKEKDSGGIAGRHHFGRSPLIHRNSVHHASLCDELLTVRLEC